MPLLACCLQVPAPENRVSADREIHPAKFFDGGSKKRVEICIRCHVGAHEAPGIAHVGEDVVRVVGGEIAEYDRASVSDELTCQSLDDQGCTPRRHQDLAVKLRVEGHR